VYELLNDKDKAKCKRITFNEITQSAILEALEKPRNIDIR
jgi:DNA topoisomerase-1